MANGLQSILVETGLAIAPLRNLNTPQRAVEFFRQLGYEFTPGAMGTALPNMATQAGELLAAVRQLAEAKSDAAIAAAIVNLLARLGTTVDAIRQLHLKLKAGGPVPHIDDFPRRLTDFLVLDYFERQQSQLHETLHLLGLIEHEPDHAPGQSMRLINWDRFGKFLTEPRQIVNDVYHWNDNFDFDKFLARLEKLMRAASMPGGLYPQAETTRTLLGNTSPDLKELRSPIFQRGLTPETYSQFGITFAPAEAKGGKKKGIALLPFLLGAAEFQFNVCDRGELVFQSTADIKGVGLVIRPPFDAEGLLNLTGAFRAVVQIREKPSQTEEIILIGSKGGTRLALQGLGVSWFVQNPQGKLDIGMEAEAKALRLVIAGGEGDGFLQKILSGLHVEAEAALALGFTLLSGFTFRGGAKLALELSTHIDLGVVKIESLRLTLGPANDQLSLETGVVLKFDLGPLKAVVENIGLQTALRFSQGNLGPAQLDISFKPPNGVGLSLDAGIIKGGGYLFFDPAREEYGGALELVFSGFLNLKAVGLITTRMPDGSKGFSLLLIITVEFGTGIQLGFGFTLLAVGGLLGLNRTMKLQQLAEGIRSGAIESVMFPKDVIANAPKIISDLRAFFPPQEGTFLIGPMAKLGWGTPTLMSVALGIIIEIPGNIAILGVLKVAIPADDVALIILQVNFMGAIEFDKKRLWFYAVLFESRIVFLTIEGEMGLLVAFGDDANFVLSVGGFHPRFSPPPLPFPSPRRIAVSLLNSPVSRVRIESYFAVTSNTVQFGARVEVFYGLDILNAQGHLAFDALFQFSPFYFIIEISASFSVKVFGAGLFSVSISGALSGPSPWHIKGHGSISLLFWDIDVDFETTWGESRNTEMPPVKVMPILEGELNKADNWRAMLPSSNNLLVSLRKLTAEEAALILHPVGVLHISQRALPLELKLDKVGSQKPSDVNRLSVALAGDGLAKRNDTFEQFAPAQYQNFSDAEKLSKPAFAPERSGLEISAKGADLRSSRLVRRIVRYEEIIIDSNYKRFQRRFSSFIRSLFNFFLDGNAAARCGLSQATRLQLQPFDEKINVQTETYTVALQSNNKAYAADSVSFHSEASARDYMNSKVAADASLADEIHVIPSFERAA